MAMIANLKKLLCEDKGAFEDRNEVELANFFLAESLKVKLSLF